MDEAGFINYITDRFEGVTSVVDDGNSFFFYGPERMMPIITLVTNDKYDKFSNLERPGIFRLNIGISKATYESLFGAQPVNVAAGATDTTYDFTALNQIMPHPLYAHMFWVSVLNPGEETLKTVLALLAEAYDLAVRKNAKKESKDKP